MLTIPKLKKYLVKIINESITQKELSELEDKYESDIIEKNIYQNLINQTYKYQNTGWQLLNYAIELLTELNDPQKHPETITDPEYKYEQIQKIVNNELQFKKIGQGAYRSVYGRSDIPFIIKLEHAQIGTKKMKSSGTNMSEYEKYLNYGSDFQPRNELFPKMYAYDKKDGCWIIFEKVNTLKNSGDVLLNMFQPLLSLWKNIYDFLENEPGFYGALGYDENYSLWQPTPEFEEFLNNPTNPYDVFGYLFEFTKDIALTCEKESHQDITLAFKSTLIDWIIQVFTGKASWLYLPRSFKRDNPDEYHLLITKFEQAFPDLKPTPDVAYLTNFLKNQPIDDLHFNNIGYRDMKNNTTQPWKNLVILDFGEYGI
jgi:hypothetical protein